MDNIQTMFTNLIPVANIIRADTSYTGETSEYEYDEDFEMLVRAFLRDMDYTSVNQAALNIVYSTLNVGLISLPFLASEGGIIAYIVAIAIVSVVSAYTSIMVIAMAQEQQVRTVEDLAECAFGPRGFIVVSIFQILFSFSLMCITLIVWADIMMDTFNSGRCNSFLMTTRYGELLLGSFIVLPLCLLKTSMASLRWTSYVTVLSISAAIIAVVCSYFTDSMESDLTPVLLAPKKQWFSLIFLIVYCFSCNQKVMTIYSSLRRRTVSRWQVAMQRAMLLMSSLYVLFGVFGYIARERRGLRIDNFNFFETLEGEDRQIFDPIRVIVALSLLLTIPVDSLVAVTAIRRLANKLRRSADQSKHTHNIHFLANNNSHNNHSTSSSQHIQQFYSHTLPGAGQLPQHKQQPHNQHHLHPQHLGSRSTTSVNSMSSQQIYAAVQQLADAKPLPASHIYSPVLLQKTQALDHEHDLDQDRSTGYEQHESYHYDQSQLEDEERSLLSASASASVSASNEASVIQQDQSYSHSDEVQSSYSQSTNHAYHSSTNPNASANRHSHITARYSAQHTNNMNSNINANQMEPVKRKIRRNTLTHSHGHSRRKSKKHNAAEQLTTTSINSIAVKNKFDQQQDASSSNDEQGKYLVRAFTAQTTKLSSIDDPHSSHAQRLLLQQKYENYDDEEKAYLEHISEKNSHTSSNHNTNTTNTATNANKKLEDADYEANHADEDCNDNDHDDDYYEDDQGFCRSLCCSAASLCSYYCPSKYEALPTIVLWALSLAVCLVVEKWLYLAASVGTFSTCMLLFIFPSMLYFRLGLASDYQAIPLFSSILPNRLYMLVIQALGLLVLFLDVLLIIYCLATGANIVKRES